MEGRRDGESGDEKMKDENRRRIHLQHRLHLLHRHLRCGSKNDERHDEKDLQVGAWNGYDDDDDDGEEDDVR